MAQIRIATRGIDALVSIPNLCRIVDNGFILYFLIAHVTFSIIIRKKKITHCRIGLKGIRVVNTGREGVNTGQWWG